MDPHRSSVVSGPDEFGVKVEKLATDGTAAARSAKKLGEELAVELGKGLAAAAAASGSGVTSLHR
eukprot:SAG11_NODE_10420_length_833_cov_0.780654_1_plen_65_part_00